MCDRVDERSPIGPLEPDVRVEAARETGRPSAQTAGGQRQRLPVRSPEQWAAHQERYRRAYQAWTAYREELQRAYGSEWRAPRSKRERFDALNRRVYRAGDAVFAWLDVHSPRRWREGVPYHWACCSLSYEDAVTDGPLAVLPPLGYGATRQSQAAALAVRRPSGLSREGFEMSGQNHSSTLIRVIA